MQPASAWWVVAMWRSVRCHRWDASEIAQLADSPSRHVPVLSGVELPVKLAIVVEPRHGPAELAGGGVEPSLSSEHRPVANYAWLDGSVRDRHGLDAEEKTAAMHPKQRHLSGCILHDGNWLFGPGELDEMCHVHARHVINLAKATLSAGKPERNEWTEWHPDLLDMYLRWADQRVDLVGACKQHV